jgi:hypothetical protein
MRATALANPYSRLSQPAFRQVAAGADRMARLVTEAFETSRPILPELLGEGAFVQWEHYPADDYFDADTGALVFYHAHAPEDRQSQEHGHFHCFVECPDHWDAAPIARPRKRTGRRLCHLAGVSIDMRGVPTELFVPNQWVTGEWLYPAAQVVPLLDRFAQVGGDRPRPLRWASQLVTVCAPQIAALLVERDRLLGEGKAAARRARDQTLDILCGSTIDVDRLVALIGLEQRRRRRVRS